MKDGESLSKRRSKLDQVIHSLFSSRWFSGDIDYVTISLFNKRPRSKDVHVAQITVHLKELDNGELIEEWFQLSPVSPQMKGDMGSVRVKVIVRHIPNGIYVYFIYRL